MIPVPSLKLFEMVKMSGIWTWSYHFVKVSWEKVGEVILEFAMKRPGREGVVMLGSLALRNEGMLLRMMKGRQYVRR